MPLGVRLRVLMQTSRVHCQRVDTCAVQDCARVELRSWAGCPPRPPAPPAPPEPPPAASPSASPLSLSVARFYYAADDGRSRDGSATSARDAGGENVEEMEHVCWRLAT